MLIIPYSSIDKSLLYWLDRLPSTSSCKLSYSHVWNPSSIRSLLQVSFVSTRLRVFIDAPLLKLECLTHLVISRCSAQQVDPLWIGNKWRGPILHVSSQLPLFRLQEPRWNDWLCWSVSVSRSYYEEPTLFLCVRSRWIGSTTTSSACE